MFEHHFGLRENPFPAGHQLKFVYPSREHQEARAHLRYGIENREPFLLITGEVGTGKTTSLYDALNEWGDRVAVALITNSSLTRQEMLEEICLRFGLPVQPNTSKPALMVTLEKHLIGVRGKGEHAVLMMDEAQNLSMDLLEEIRLLSNLEHRGDKLLQIFLVGQPELEAHLARHELRQLRQRITVHYRLNPLSADETLGYIHHHINVAGGNGVLVFPTDTCREIFRLTHGIPREINTIASSALIAAYADGSPHVSPEHVVAVAQEGDFRSVLAGPVVRHAEPVPTPPRPAPPVAMPQAPPPPTLTPRPQVVSTAPAEMSWPALPQLHAEPPRAPAAAPPASPVPAAASASPPEPLAAAPPVAAPAPAAAAPPQSPPPPAQPAVPVAPVANVTPLKPPAAPRESGAARRERGEFSKGVVAAMKLTEAAATAPSKPPPAKRPTFATPPPPVPLPLPENAARESAAARRPDPGALPPRLRDRLERELSREDTGMPPLRGWLIAVSVLATVGIVLILMQRFGAIDVPLLRGPAGTPSSRTSGDAGEGVAPTTPGASDPSAAVLDSLGRAAETAAPTAPVRTAASRTTPVLPQPSRVTSDPTEVGNVETPVPATRPAGSGTSSLPTNPTAPRSTPATRAPGGAAGATRPAAGTGTTASAAQFGVGVASYLDEVRANEERDRYAAETAQPAIVVPYTDAGTTMFRVVIGRWPSSTAAEHAANTLMERGVINEARVMRLPRP
jgi:type II secretory pathway predicted ATPase ExeA